MSVHTGRITRPVHNLPLTLLLKMLNFIDVYIIYKNINRKIRLYPGKKNRLRYNSSAEKCARLSISENRLATVIHVIRMLPYWRTIFVSLFYAFLIPTTLRHPLARIYRRRSLFLFSGPVRTFRKHRDPIIIITRFVRPPRYFIRETHAHVHTQFDRRPCAPPRFIYYVPRFNRIIKRNSTIHISYSSTYPVRL